MAEFLGSETVLVDICGGPAATAAGLREAAAALGCDLIALVDVGGDVLAHGHEPGLASPLCDAVMLAAGIELAAELPVLCGVHGAGLRRRAERGRGARADRRPRHATGRCSGAGA